MQVLKGCLQYPDTPLYCSSNYLFRMTYTSQLLILMCDLEQKVGGETRIKFSFNT